MTFNAGSLAKAALLKVPLINRSLLRILSHMKSALNKALTAILDMACQAVPDLSALKHVIREIMLIIPHATERKVCPASV